MNSLRWCPVDVFVAESAQRPMCAYASIRGPTANRFCGDTPINVYNEATGEGETDHINYRCRRCIRMLTRHNRTLLQQFMNRQ